MTRGLFVIELAAAAWLALAMDSSNSSAKPLSRREAIRRGTSLAAAVSVPFAAVSASAADEQPAPSGGAPVVHFEIGCRD